MFKEHIIGQIKQIIMYLNRVVIFNVIIYVFELNIGNAKRDVSKVYKPAYLDHILFWGGPSILSRNK